MPPPANLTVTGVRAAAAGSVPGTSLLTDYFADLSGWTTITQGAGVGIAATNGELQISIPSFSSGNRYGVVASTSTVDLTGATVTTKVRIGNVEAGMEAGLTLRLDASNYLTIEAAGAATTVDAYKYVGGVYTLLGTNTAAALLTHFRIRESLGTVYLEYSTTGGMTWTTHSSVLVSALWAVTSLGVRLAGGDDGPTGSGTMVVAFDYLTVTKPTVAADGLLTAPVGPLTAASGVSVGGIRSEIAAVGNTGLTGMFSGWTGPGVNSPFVIGATPAATATARPGTVAINSVTTQNAVVVGSQAAASATGQPGTLSTVAHVASGLVVEIDFLGNPTAPYFDQVSQQTGVQSYWRFDDTSTLDDSVGLNGGTVVATPTLITGALAYDSNQALRFNGTTQYAQLPATAPLNLSGSYTFLGWFRFPTLPSAVTTIFTKGAFRLLTTAANKLQLGIEKDDSGVLTSTLVTSNTTLAANTWYLVGCVHDADNDQIRLYLNGVLDSAASHSVGTEQHVLPFTFAGVPSATLPAFRAYARGGSPGGGGLQSLYVIPRPTYATGDLLIAQVFDQATTLTPPSGWSLLCSSTGAANTFQRIYWKFATASESSSYTWTASGANPSSRWVGAIISYSGVDTSCPFAKPPYAYTVNSPGNTGTTYTHLIDTTNGLVLAFMTAVFGATDNLVSSWSSGTEQYDVSADVFGIAMASQAPAYMSTLTVTAVTTAAVIESAFVILNGTGVLAQAAVDLDEWSFAGAALTDEEVADRYEARLSGVGTWTEVSADTREFALGYGRQYELNRMEAGGANLTLKNLQRKYDPANSSSVLAPNVKPNRKVRVRALIGGVYYPLWEGLVERWPSDWGISNNYDELKVTSADGYKMMNLASIATAMDAGLAGTQLNEAMKRALWPLDKRAVDDGKFILAAQTDVGVTSAKTVCDDIADSELGIFFIDHTVDGSPATFHDQSHRWTDTRSLVSQATFTDQPTGGLRYRYLVPSDDDDNIVNEWRVTSANGTEGTATDTVSRQANGPIVQERSTRLDNPADAVVQARALLQQTSRTALRFDALTVRLTAQTPVATWQTLLGLAISDRVTVTRNPVPAAGGSTITQVCFIEGISWAITPNYWDVSYQLSPISSLPFYDTVLIMDPVSYWRMEEST